MNRFRLRFASAFVPGRETFADKVARRAARWVLAVATFAFVQGCARDIPSQQASAYSTATGFLTLCDDSDFDHALEHFAKPLKASPAGATWVKEMQDHRGAYGLPLIRSLVSRDSQKIRGTADEPAQMSFVFRTSFLGTTPGDEYVSVEKVDGKWQVYDYKFRPSGKPPSEIPKANIKKSWEEQTDQDQ
ncbi:MAG: DUF4019 domain-containing protein [Verrucomicrobia bacterium]|nr:DUF4019 domain-containing protein [Verrucomicrobiota bacterium]